MKDSRNNPESRSVRPENAARKEKKPSLSMHEGIAVWCDCCTCEAEPYWVEIAAEMGIALGSDYEDADPANGSQTP